MDRTSREEWAKRVERWRDSGLTAAEFAAELGINAHSLSWWKWRLAAEQAKRGPTRRSSSRRPRVTAVPSPLTFLRDDSTRAAGAARDRPGHRCSRPSAIRLRRRSTGATARRIGARSVIPTSGYASSCARSDRTCPGGAFDALAARGQGAARARSAEWRALRLREPNGAIAQKVLWFDVHNGYCILYKRLHAAPHSPELPETMAEATTTRFAPIECSVPSRDDSSLASKNDRRDRFALTMRSRVDL